MFEDTKYNQRLTVEETAEILQLGLLKVKAMLKQKLVPFGFAIEGERGNFEYVIFKGRLEAYLKGELR
jgi:hypothetical protein